MSFDFNQVGIQLPLGWKTIKLGDVAEVNAESVKKSNEPNEIWYIDISSVSSGEMENPKRLKYSDAPSRARRRLKNNDIIISTVRPNLRQYAILENVGENWVASTGFCVVSVHDPETAWYLYSVITSDIFTDHLVRVADGGTYPTFNPREIENAIIPWPDSYSLKKINHIVKVFEKKISLNTEINQTLESIAQAIFKSWFIDYEPVRAKMAVLNAGGTFKDAEHAAIRVISGIDDTGLSELKEKKTDVFRELTKVAAMFPSTMQESDLGNIPEGWAISEIGREVTVVGGATPSTRNSEFWDGGSVNWATPKDLSNIKEKILIETERKITEEGLKRISSGLLPANTVLMSSRAPVGYLAIAKVPLAINQGFIAMVCDKILPPEFVVQWCGFQMDEIKQRASGTTFAEISKKSFSPIPVIVPSHELIEKYTNHVKLIYSRIEDNIYESRILSQLKESILPKLLSGEIELMRGN